MMMVVMMMVMTIMTQMENVCEESLCLDVHLEVELILELQHHLVALHGRLLQLAALSLRRLVAAPPHNTQQHTSHNISGSALQCTVSSRSASLTPHASSAQSLHPPLRTQRSP